jgi:hypothetical protein
MRAHLYTEGATLLRIGAKLRRFESGDGTGGADAE